MSTNGNDAQREMEQRALRNVRALVDKYEATDEQHKQGTRRLLVVSLVVTVAICIVVFLVIRSTKTVPVTKTIELPPAGQAGPPR